MLDKNIFVNITSTSYSKSLNFSNSTFKEGSPSHHAEQAISIHYRTIYLERKSQNWIYLILFYLLAILFATCAFLIYFKSPNYNCGLFFKNCDMVKNFINLLCTVLAIGAFCIGYTIRPEKEALSYLTHKIQKELGNPSFCTPNPLFQHLTLKSQTHPVESITIQ